MKKRFAFKMFLKPGFEDEYAKRHAAIWPELKQMIKDQGVSNYSIYWDKDTNILFAYQECEGEGNSQDTDNVDPSTWISRQPPYFLFHQHLPSVDDVDALLRSL